jgi:hypothetical protein
MIYAIGDSFTAGAELESVDQAWPAQLEKLLGKTVVNQGLQGSGNTRIIKRTIDAVFNNAELIIIGWSDPARIELADEAGVYDIWPARLSMWSNDDDKRHRVDLIKYATIHDVPKYHYANWLRQILLVQSFCKFHDVKCLMFIAYYTNQLHKQYSPEFEHLVKHIDTSMFIGNTMYESTSEWTYGCTKMPNGHPGPEGHVKITNKIYEHIRNLSWLS